jgi:hypothetical protein
MSSSDARGLHERGNVVGEQLRRIRTLRLFRFACSSEIDGNTGEVPGVLWHLKRIAGIIRGQIGNENEWLSRSLLVIVHGDVVGYRFGHWLSLPRSLPTSSP